ncbi:unnamed protein product, partial [marine sediment metagenome]
IESLDGTSVLIRDAHGLYFWSPKDFGQKPVLYKTVRKARQEAHTRDGIVKHYRNSQYNMDVEFPF